MEFMFFSSAMVLLFSRSDMESGHWVQQEYSVNADFPYLPDKVIETGQLIAFRDPATDVIQVFEIRTVSNTPGDRLQQITAEHIAVSELSDEHINTTEITDETAGGALASVLGGTEWSVGTNTASGTQSADISRGSVWNAVGTICSNWNVYITPRVVISSSGVITMKYLDITPAEGTFRGLRLSLNKNMMDDSVVTYDETELYTALYGYGGNVTVEGSGDDEDTTEELTFADEVWTQTSEHPAKPSGQTYLEWPEKTALYGRHGRPRFGYYQNGDITDAETLLEKTWETLKTVSEPTITISGTCADLYRLGYKDQPLRLHDIAIVEIEDTGEIFQREIIQLDVDLVDPTGSRPTIGDYIPNIIYINRETEEESSGSGGGGGHGQTNTEHEDGEFYTDWVKTNQMIGMVVGTYNGGYKIKAGQIILAMNDDGGSEATIEADVINMNGVVQALEAYDIVCGNLTCGSISCTDITSQGNVHGDNITADLFIDTDGDISAGGDISATGDISCDGMSCSSLTIGSPTKKTASWKSKTVVTGVGVTLPSITRSQSRYFMYTSTSGGATPAGTETGRIISGFTDGSVNPTTETIYYLGADS